MQFNTGHNPSWFPSKELMIGLVEKANTGYLKYKFGNEFCKGVFALGAYITATSEKGGVKYEFGTEHCLDISKKIESLHTAITGFFGAKVTKGNCGVQFKFDKENLTTSVFAKPVPSLKLTLTDEFNVKNLIKDFSKTGYRYGLSAEWEI